MFMKEELTSYMFYSSMNTFYAKYSGVDHLLCKKMGYQATGSNSHMPMRSGRGLTGGGQRERCESFQGNSAFSKERQELSYSVQGIADIPQKKMSEEMSLYETRGRRQWVETAGCELPSTYKLDS